jgi:SPW repeat
VLLFVAPWVLTYTDRVGASWTSWVVGAIAVVLGGFSVPASNRIHRQAILP